MSFEIWLAFVAACTVLTLIPGPSVLLVVSLTITRGLPAALICILGDMLASVFLMGLSLLGAGAILAASATLFALLKWVGVFYMAYLGLSQIRQARRETAPDLTDKPRNFASSSFNTGFLTAMFNPKAILFYMAFLPQFMVADGEPLLQFSILVITSTLTIGVLLSGYALIATSARRTFQSAKARKYFGYTGGSCLIGGSVLIATTR